MYCAEQIATVQEVYLIGNKHESYSISFYGHDARMKNYTGFSVTIRSTKN